MFCFFLGFKTPRYAQGGTFTLTNATSASATINFNGTSIWVYGSKRPNHSAYQATFDGTTTTYDGRGDELNQQVIFSATDLNSGPHTVSMANLGSGYYGYLDIDYVSAFQFFPFEIMPPILSTGIFIFHFQRRLFLRPISETMTTRSLQLKLCSRRPRKILH